MDPFGQGWDRAVVHATSDELTRPLGVDGQNRRPVRFAFPFAKVFAATLVVAAGAVATYVALVRDPLGGQPHALAPIQTRPATSTDAGPPAAGAQVQEIPSEVGRRTASQVETASGVSVVRPDGANAPESLVIRIDDPAIRLNPAPDQRLIERSRFGLLPRVGPDGAKAAQVYARPEGASPGGSAPAARIAIVVGGIGLNAAVTTEAISKLPPAVTLALAPYGDDLERQAAQARDAGHEIMLQVPMEPLDGPTNNPGPQTLTTGAKPADNIERLRWAMGRFVGYVGVINYMGAKLTGDEAALTPIAREIATRGLAIIDDGSSSRSLTTSVAARFDVPTARCNVVLDAVSHPDAIDKALARLEARAHEHGFAIASASALPMSVDRIARWTQGLQARGILLVPVSSAFRQRTGP